VRGKWNCFTEGAAAFDNDTRQYACLRFIKLIFYLNWNDLFGW